MWDLNGIDAQTLEQWHHWVFVKDETTGNMSVYFNGELADSSNVVDRSLANIQNKPFKVGAPTDQYNDYVGKMDNFRVYDYALSHAEIVYLATDGRGLFLMDSPAYPYDQEELGDRAVNFRDYAVLAENWLEKKLWPLE